MVFPIMGVLIQNPAELDNLRREQALITKRFYEQGIYKTRWDIYNSERSNNSIYLNHERTFFEKILGQKIGFKSPSESPHEYISRMIYTGKNIVRLDNKDSKEAIYSIKKNIGLEFHITNEINQTETEEHLFWDTKTALVRDSQLESVEGIIPIHTHILTLEYVTWHFTDDLQTKGGYELCSPDTIIYLK